MAEMIQIAPFIKERLKLSPEGYGQLIGMRCQQCGETVFPAETLCPKCTGSDVVEVALSRRGKIYSYTIVYESYGNFVGLVPPYPIMFVQLSDGACVHAPLIGCKPDEIKIDMDVELSFLEFMALDGTRQRVYAFTPVKEKSTYVAEHSEKEHSEGVTYVR